MPGHSWTAPARVERRQPYTLHFDAGQFPPSNPQAFWSVTMYNAELLNLVDNAINQMPSAFRQCKSMCRA